MQHSSPLLSVFDSHIHPVLALDRESGFLTYGNVKATELFKIPSNLNRITLADVCANIKPSGNEEHFYHATAIFKLNRLDSNQFSDTILFFEPIEEQPGKKSLQTGELAASLVAHLFRSPLTALIGLAEMVSTSTEENKDLISKALTDGLHRIGGFVDDLDDFNTEYKSDIQRVNIGALLQTLLYELPADKRRLIELNTTNFQYEVNTDAKLLKEICNELIDNAFDFGTDTLSPVKIDLIDSRYIRISNTGYLPNEIEEQIFIPFYTTKSQNWGLGLSKAIKKATAIGATLRLINNSRIDGIVFEIYFTKPD